MFHLSLLSSFDKRQLIILHELATRRFWSCSYLATEKVNDGQATALTVGLDWLPTVINGIASLRYQEARSRELTHLTSNAEMSNGSIFFHTNKTKTTASSLSNSLLVLSISESSFSDVEQQPIPSVYSGSPLILPAYTKLSS